MGRHTQYHSFVLGVLWNKVTDQIAVKFPHLNVEPTKRHKLASCYDSVRLAAPVLLVGSQFIEIAVNVEYRGTKHYQNHIRRNG